MGVNGNVSGATCKVNAVSKKHLSYIMFRATQIFLIFTLFILLSPTNLFSQTQQDQLIDSLEQCQSRAETDWEKLDLAFGLYRQASFSYQQEKADLQIGKVRALGESIPSAEAYAFIMESLRATWHEVDFDKAIAKCQEAIEVSKKTRDHNTLAYARYQLAELYAFDKGDIQKALDLMLESMKDIDESVSIKTQGNCNKVLGHIYMDLGQYEEANQYFEKARMCFDELINNTPMHPKTGKPSAEYLAPEVHLNNTYNYMGDLYHKQGRTEDAIEIKMKGLKLMEKVNNTDYIAWMLQRVGLLYLDQGKLEIALDYLQKSRLLFEELNATKDIIQCNSILIDIYLLMKDRNEVEKYLGYNLAYYEEKKDSSAMVVNYIQGIDLYSEYGDIKRASELLDKAASIADAMQNMRNRALIHIKRGEIALKNENYSDAVSRFKKALIHFESEKDLTEIPKIFVLISDAYGEMNAMDSAILFVDKAIADAMDNKDLELSREAHELKSELLAKKGDFAGAYDAHKRFFSLHDSLYTSNALAKLKEEQVRQNVVDFQKEKEFAEQNAALLAKQNQIYIGVGVVILIILLLMAYLYLNLRKVKAKIQSQNLQLTQLNQTKDKFFGIIAHDLRSPLIGLQGVGDQVDYYLKKGDTDRLEKVSKSISSTTKKLNELLDNLLNWALLQNGMIPYHPTKVNVKNAVDSTAELLAQFAQEKNVKLINNVGENTHVYADEKALNTILRNLISNALKYTESGGEVVTKLEDQGSKYSILINDTGTGISTEQLPQIFGLEKESKQGTHGEKGTGLGLVLCKELVELNQGTIQVESTPGKGSTFSFNLPKVA